MASEEHYREYCQRRHRTVAANLAIRAWALGLDCVVLERGDVERLLGIETVKGKRLEWLRDDVRPWFKHFRFFKRGNAHGSVWLSRVPLDDLPGGTLTPAARAALARKLGTVRAEVCSKVATAKTEREMGEELATFAMATAVPSVPIGIRVRVRLRKP